MALSTSEEIFPGIDNRGRVARLRTMNGARFRPIQRLYPLEISASITTITNDVPSPDDMVLVRPHDTDPNVAPTTSNDRITESDTTTTKSLMTEKDSRQQKTSRCGRIVKVPRRLDL